MMDALLHYKFHYIIDVDKEALKVINGKLYPDMFGSYFVETNEHPIDSLHTNWKRYDPYHIICGYEFKKQLNGETYYQKELSQATSPLFKEICNAYEATGSLPLLSFWESSEPTTINVWMLLKRIGMFRCFSLFSFGVIYVIA